MCFVSKNWRDRVCVVDLTLELENLPRLSAAREAGFRVMYVVGR